MGAAARTAAALATLATANAAWALCPGPNTVEGIDISVWQGTIDWARVRAAGKEFAFARVANGTTVDTKFDANWPAMKAAGVLRGAYQYWRPGQDAMAQANVVIAEVGQLGPGDLPVVADVEATDGQTAATIISKLQTWIAVVEAGTGRRPIVYTARYFWNTNVNSTAFNSYPLWVANYYVSCPSLPAAWSDFLFWQYTDSGSVDGITGNVDLDIFNGTRAELEHLAGLGPPDDLGTGPFDGGVDLGLDDAGLDGGLDAGDTDGFGRRDMGRRGDFGDRDGGWEAEVISGGCTVGWHRRDGGWDAGTSALGLGLALLVLAFARRSRGRERS